MRLIRSEGWKEDDAYITHFDASTPLMRRLLACAEKPLYIFNPGDDAILGNEGMLAGLIRQEVGGKIFGMLKIESIGFMDLNIRTAETFRILCEWIGQTYANMEKLTTRQVEAMHYEALENTGKGYFPVAKKKLTDTDFAYPRPAKAPKIIQPEMLYAS